ncbi:conserved hypothetical protein [Paraburkholderia tropica]
MSPSFRMMRPDELEAPQDMEPAVVLGITLNRLLRALNLNSRDRSIPIFNNRDRDALYLEMGDVQLAFVAFAEEPREVHVYAHDRDVRRAEKFVQLLEQLPLEDIDGAWWVRSDQPYWPGNNAKHFTINSHSRRRPHTFRDVGI